LQDPILKNPSQERAGRVAQGVGPEFKPQFHKKKKKKKKKKETMKPACLTKLKIYLQIINLSNVIRLFIKV
jgi:hypothetical protein